MNILNGKELSYKIKQELIGITTKLERKPGLVVIQVGNDLPSSVYVKNKERLAKEIGINFQHFHFVDISEIDLIKKISKLNKDKMVDGIIIQLPLPKHIDEHKIINTVDPSKDVDGLTDINMGKIISGQEAFIPCTPYGILELFKEYKINVEGKHVVIVGRSRLVGKPLSSILLNMNATVTICHSKTTDLKHFTKQADILIVAVGKRGLIGSKMVKKGAIVIDVGINRIDNKLYGDVDYNKVAKKTSYITPVPGGVGPMTVIMLMTNVIKSYQKR